MIILSIPYLSNKFIQKQVEKARIDWKEFRLDFHRNYKDFPQKFIDSKTIITFRDATEGGINQISFNEKISYYQELILKYNCLVDCEILLYKNQCIPTSNLVLSYHDFSENLDIKKLKQIIKKSNSIPSKYLKLAVKITKYTQLNLISNLIQTSNKPVLFAGIGKLGKISRILYQFISAEETYIGLEDYPTANGQITENEAEKYDLTKVSKNTQIGGIVGGEQVENSLGLIFYNQYFQSNKIDAIYLTFVVKDFNDFWKWINTCKFKNKFYGFSITMPFKKKSEFRNQNSKDKKFPVTNLYLPKSDEVFNTDIIAFKNAIKYLNIKKDEKILIYGTGAMAETALISFIDFDSIYLSGRNIVKGKELTSQYSRTFIHEDSINQKGFDVIINCTPIGMNNEDFLKKTKLLLPKKVIDLPYIKKNTLLINYCIENEIEYVDGEKFWKWQAESQIEKFIIAIQR
ncbi:MAG: type I 3-dehydroquinate dehydratase [Candidatus Cloacimonetes bacterium]|nr:type I 3-dehydroquinate dehydratase [Candidatus Cloacimonadota bacterium]